MDLDLVTKLELGLITSKRFIKRSLRAETLNPTTKGVKKINQKFKFRNTRSRKRTSPILLDLVLFWVTKINKCILKQCIETNRHTIWPTRDLINFRSKLKTCVVFLLSHEKKIRALILLQTVKWVRDVTTKRKKILKSKKFYQLRKKIVWIFIGDTLIK